MRLPWGCLRRLDGRLAVLPAGGVIRLSLFADRLTAVTTVLGTATLFTIDAPGRHASRSVGTAPAESYSYLDSGNTVIGISSTGGSTTSAIDAVGNRVATAAGGAYGYLLADLHGNTAAALNSAATAITDAFAYDAYGLTVASVTSALPTPWRYQGRILESAAGTPDLYDFGARSYSPTLGAFTSLDTLHGSAGNPALLNGYLYANANPATLVDPDGHCAGYGGCNVDMRLLGNSGGPGGEGSCSLAYRGGCGRDTVIATSRQKHIQNSTAPNGGYGGMAVASAGPTAAAQATARGIEDGWARDAAADKAAADKAYAEAHKCDNHALWDLGCTGNDLNNFKNSAVDTANKGWQATGGAAVNAVAKDPLGVLAGVAVIAISAGCIVGSGAVATAACLFAAGASMYSLGIGVKNVTAENGDLTTGWNPYHALLSGGLAVGTRNMLAGQSADAAAMTAAAMGGGPGAMTLAAASVWVGQAAPRLGSGIIGFFLGIWPDGSR